MYTRAVDLKRLRFITTHTAHLKPGESRILDIGCGNGNISIHLGSLGHNVLGIDISEKTIAKARSNNKFPNVKFEVVSAEELQASGPQYDVIICSEVLEHLQKPEDLVRVIERLLKEDGRLIVTVPNGYGPRESLMTKPMQWMQRSNGILWKFIKGVKRLLGYSGKTVQSEADDLTHIQFFTKRSLTNLLGQHRFKIAAFENADFIEDVFPFSLVTKRVNALQRFDCAVADILPHYFTGGFHTLWLKNTK